MTRPTMGGECLGINRRPQVQEDPRYPASLQPCHRQGGHDQRGERRDDHAPPCIAL